MQGSRGVANPVCFHVAVNHRTHGESMGEMIEEQFTDRRWQWLIMDPILGIGGAMHVVFQGHPEISASLAPSGSVLVVSRRGWLHPGSLCQHGPLLLLPQCDLALAWKPHSNSSRGANGSAATCCSLLAQANETQHWFDYLNIASLTCICRLIFSPLLMEVISLRETNSCSEKIPHEKTWFLLYMLQIVGSLGQNRF